MTRPSAALKLAAAVLLLGPALAGCVDLDPQGDMAGAAPPVSLPDLEGLIAEHTPFVASDGVDLDMWTFRPDVGPDVKVPVILQDSPYYGNADPTIEDGGQAFSLWLVEEFVPRGYAVVLKSVRGTGSSGGCFGMGDLREAEDGYEVVEALAAEPWSNGNVAMIGKSYRGTTPIQTAVLAPPSLKTIVPIAGITEWYLYVTSPGGVAYKDWLGFNTLYQQYVGLDSSKPSPESPGNTPRYAQKVCPAVAELAVTDTHSAATGEYNEGWEARNYAKDTDKITASVYLIHGFQDFNVKPDQIAPWFNHVKSFKHALLGQWPHEYPYRLDWRDDLVAWFDHELKEFDNGVDRWPAVKVEDNLGRWRYESEWPPTRAANLTLVPGADGALVEADAAAGVVTLIGDPNHAPNGAAGTNERQLVAATDVLTADVHVAGIPRLTLSVSLDREHGVLALTLYDVDPDGKWNPINWAFTDTRHRNSLRESEPMTPVIDEALVPLTLFPMDHVFEAGHRIAFALAPQDPTWIQTSNEATLMVRVGDGALLDLPVVPTALLEDPQPDWQPFDELDWYDGP